MYINLSAIVLFLRSLGIGHIVTKELKKISQKFSSLDLAMTLTTYILVASTLERGPGQINSLKSGQDIIKFL